jgi:uncharacterized protein (TIGR00730 family)
MQHIAVFCGSKPGKNPKYLEATLELGALLGTNKKHVIYGGGNVGLMGAIANATLQHGGTVTGIIPGFLNSVERQHQHLTHLIETETMHERKKLLFEKSDMAIILPGGYGTLDELFEMLTWNQLELHKIKVVILNVDGFYNHLRDHIRFVYSQQFLYGDPGKEIHFIETVAALQALF